MPLRVQRCQFLQTDPVGTKDDPNLYKYAQLNPSNASDPFGLDTLTLGPELEITPGVGFSAGYGVAVSFPTPWDPKAEWDAGIFGYISGRAGLHGSAGLASWAPNGSVRDLGGFSGEVSGTAGAFTGNVTFPIRAGRKGEPALVFDRGEAGGNAGTGSLRTRQANTSEVPIPGRTQGSVGVGGSVGLRAGGTLTIRQAVESAFGKGATARENQDGSVSVTRPKEGSRLRSETRCVRGSDGKPSCN